MQTIPLNIAYVASYAQKLYGNALDIRLFKDPRKLLKEAEKNPPDVLGLSCYYWNVNLDVLVARHIKRMNSSCIVALGGPSIDTDSDEQFDLYRSFGGNLDVMVLNEGELGFAAFLSRALSSGWKGIFDETIDGCTFFRNGNDPVYGKDIGLSLDLDALPSPLLGGLLDDFLVADYMPIIQTSRMCPYSCSYCCSGKLKGRIRTFSESVVKDEIDYIAKRYRDWPHRALFITDENFGINRRDVAVAAALAASKKTSGYPMQTFCYFDKKLTDTVKESALLFADMNSGGLQLAFQSFNENSLKAVKRKNMTNDEMQTAVAWAGDNGLKTFSEMIFGLPYETRDSFLDSLEYLMHLGIDTLAAHNLFLVKGIELNRKSERERFGLITKFRPTFAAAYDIINDEFVCESEEVVVSSAHFSYEDFINIRKISLMFYIANSMEFFNRVYRFLIMRGHKVIPLFDAIMNPATVVAEVSPHAAFVEDFVRSAQEELFTSHDDVVAYLRDLFIGNGNSVAAPSRLNVLYASRLIYQEASWFSKVLHGVMELAGVIGQDAEVIGDLMAVSAAEWVDIRHPDRERTVEVCRETLNWLGIMVPAQQASQYRLSFSTSDIQQRLIDSYNNHFLSDDDSYYYNVLDFIQPRKYLRYEQIEVEPLVV